MGLLVKMIRKMDNRYGRGRKRYYVIKKYIEYVEKETLRCGNEYGGFNVFPGGVDKDKKIVYSFGIGEDLSFSENVLKNFNAEIYAFDPTPKAVEYVKKSNLNFERGFSFFEYALGVEDGEDVFYLPENENYVSGSLCQRDSLKTQGIKIEKKRLITIMAELGHKKIDILKIDIEGSEFEVIDNIIEDNIDFLQLCLEIHDRFFDDGLIRLEKMLKKLKSAGYILVSMSDNIQELTFILKSVYIN